MSTTPAAADGSIVRVTKPYLEVLFLYSLLFAYDLFFRDGDRFAVLTPHPFWIPILLFAAHYGTSVGLLSAACATTILLVGNMPPEFADEEIYAYWRRVGGLPMMWIVTSVILGEIAVRQRQALRRAQEELNESIEREELLCEAFVELEHVKQTREREIAALTSSSVQIMNVVSGVSLRDPSAIMERVLELVSLALQPQKFSLYVLKNDNLSLALAKGWTADDKFGTRFTKSSALYDAIVKDGDIVSVLDFEKAQILGSEGVLAAPLVDMRSKRVLGMIKLEDLDWSHVTSHNITLLRLIGEWSGSMYMFAQQFHVKKPRTAKREKLATRPTPKLLPNMYRSDTISLESQ